jgi:hypothetical protein
MIRVSAKGKRMDVLSKTTIPEEFSELSVNRACEGSREAGEASFLRKR